MNGIGHTTTPARGRLREEGVNSRLWLHSETLSLKRKQRKKVKRSWKDKGAYGALELENSRRRS